MLGDWYKFSYDSQSNRASILSSRYSALSPQSNELLSILNKFWNQITNDDLLWRRQCFRVWAMEDKALQSWKLQFIDMFHEKKLAKYVKVYRRIFLLWRDIKSVLIQNNCSNVLESIKAGIDEKYLEEYEASTNISIPLDLRCSYRIHNGQMLNCASFLGTLPVANRYRSEILLSFEDACTAFPICQSVNLKNVFPLTFCPYTGMSQFISLNKLFNAVVCPGLGYLSKAENFTVFIMASSFTEWLSTYASNIKANASSFHRGEVPAHIRPLNHTEETNNISVEVSSCFLPEISSSSNFCFSYRITCKLKSLDDPNCVYQCLRHRFKLIDDNDVVVEINGDGAAGHRFKLYPNGNYSFTSDCAIRTPSGSLEGCFIFTDINPDSRYFGQQFEVQCPRLSLRSSNYLIELS